MQRASWVEKVGGGSWNFPTDFWKFIPFQSNPDCCLPVRTSIIIQQFWYYWNSR